MLGVYVGKHSVSAPNGVTLSALIEQPSEQQSFGNIVKRGTRRALREEARRESLHSRESAVQIQKISAPSTPSEDIAVAKASLPTSSAPLALAQATPSSPNPHSSVSYAEYMNEHFVRSQMADAVLEVPRRFTGLFSHTRALTATLVAAMLGVSGMAMASGTPTQTSSHVAAASSLPAFAVSHDSDTAPKVTLNVKVDGKTHTIAAQKGATLGKALSEAGIHLGEHDEISQSLSSKISDTTAVTITRVTTKTVTEEFTEPFETTEEKTDTLKKGETETVSEGQSGSGTRTYTVFYKDGKESSRIVALEAVTAKPVNKVVKVGTRETNTPNVGNRVVTGSKSDWLAAAGVPESDWSNADWLVSRESGWNPNALNSSSGACGLAQALPCSKIGEDWNDPVVALKWMYNYVNSRYGGFAGAVEHSQNFGWY